MNKYKIKLKRLSIKTGKVSFITYNLLKTKKSNLIEIYNYLYLFDLFYWYDIKGNKLSSNQIKILIDEVLMLNINQ